MLFLVDLYVTIKSRRSTRQAKAPHDLRACQACCTLTHLLDAAIGQAIDGTDWYLCTRCRDLFYPPLDFTTSGKNPFKLSDLEPLPLPGM